VNGFIVNWEGYADDQGIYRAKLTHGEHEITCNDFMHTLIERFTLAARGRGGEVIVPGDAGLLNLEFQVELLRRAKRH
jgi:hypothetical protein